LSTSERALWRRAEPSRLAEATPFTDYLRALESSGEPSDLRSLEAVRKALKTALVGELRRRGLWEGPPSYLGVYGWDRWDAETGSGSGPLEELLADAYFFIFVSRQRSLQAQLKIKPNIEGLVFLNIRHFLHERQKEHDPLGSQVFEVLQAAVRESVRLGELHVLAGDERVRNDSVLGFDPGAAPAALSDLSRLRERVLLWDDDLLPDLVTLRGKRQEDCVRRLRERLPELLEDGIEIFRFKDLVDPMKADVRARWAALLETTERLVAATLREEGQERFVLPDTSLEERELFRKLVSCVLDEIEDLEVNDKTRSYLNRLWQFLRVQAAGSGAGRPVSLLESEVLSQSAGDGEELPSRRRVSELLGIPRERLSDLYETLGTLLERCRSAMSGKLSVRRIKGDHAFRQP
jgi:hypothetical protein